MNVNWPRILIVAFVLVFLVALGGGMWVGYAGSATPFLLFNVSFTAMMWLAFSRPRSFVYLFFSLFMFLGFWLKLAAHTLLGLTFLEPVGSFDGAPLAWDRALLASSAAAIGVTCARILQITWMKKQPTQERRLPPPAWYGQWRTPIWAVTFIAIVAMNTWNLWAAFYQIGVNPRLVLPAHMNVAVAWLINMGFALWIATLIHWEVSHKSIIPRRIFWIPVLEGIITGVSTLSRFAFLSHDVPYLFTPWGRNGDEPTLLGKGKARFAFLLVVAFVVGLVVIQAGRSFIYFANTSHSSAISVTTHESILSSPSASTSSYFLQMIKQFPFLLVGRWLGLEGVLAVSAYPHTGIDLLIQGLTENPKLGNQSLYQTIARSAYLPSERFTFLTLPGITAVLLYSGSLVVVATGMAFVTLFMMGIELSIRKWLGNPFLLGVSAMAMTFVVCQTNFPYLTLVFFIQLIFTLIMLWVLQTLPARRARSIVNKAIS